MHEETALVEPGTEVCGLRLTQEQREREAALAGADADTSNEAPEDFLDPLIQTIMQARC